MKEQTTTERPEQTIERLETCLALADVFIHYLTQPVYEHDANNKPTGELMPLTQLKRDEASMTYYRCINALLNS